ncbi:MAG TPA: NAD(+) diphosphatase [Candidatus Angelobacter sp.]|nr:NAD(+) diphosphatase [Candidatus Angelobacter sp.]
MPDTGLLTSLTLARGDVDRAAERRDDATWFEAAWDDPATRVLLVHRDRVPVRADAAGADEGRSLAFVPPASAPYAGVRVLLAVEGGVAHVALLAEDSLEPWDAPEGAAWQGLREVGAALGDRDAALLVMAVALANWHATHPRCPRCGVATVPAQAGWSRTCPSDASQHFPRSDPAVIVLVTDDADRALLGRRAEWPEGWYSTLAGFVEAGESAEMTVLREMAEEAGVVVDRLDYLGSQPWPFPSSLMLGYRARVAAGSPDARPDGAEITELRWFTREEMSAGCAAGTVRIPPRISIARRLVEHWYGAELPGSWSRP